MLTDRLPVMMLLSATIGAGSGVAGLFISYYGGVASGASVVLVATAIFGLIFLFSPQNGLITAPIRRRPMPASASARRSNSACAPSTPS